MNDRDDDPPGMDRYTMPEAPRWLKRMFGKVAGPVNPAGKTGNKAKSRLLTGVGFQLVVGFVVHLLNSRQ
ncbi:hypothetical protein [Cryobacterium psychrophilum]|uniref:Uncharacterized protein n=1 Tax=Cryobacterium psychrophilum TaxID=41988 RepID=A0A4Y8KR84_9MICO|nr:hypothetical protein [Cryobacterium psychrophilum]TDW31288.1 hypothetical protein EDD25_3094 [Cryobacterium psychrophilum]TFD78424.1 hypothetical protein E3T53_09515 [Cryobacterium psychrophilum]